METRKSSSSFGSIGSSIGFIVTWVSSNLLLLLNFFSWSSSFLLWSNCWVELGYLIILAKKLHICRCLRSAKWIRSSTMLSRWFESSCCRLSSDTSICNEVWSCFRTSTSASNPILLLVELSMQITPRCCCCCCLLYLLLLLIFFNKCFFPPRNPSFANSHLSESIFLKP